MNKQILIDKRTKEDIELQLKNLALGYTPEWSFDDNKPDIGTTIAKIYASQVSDNIESMNQIIDRYYAEFINLLDISVNPAIPAKSIVIMELVQDTIKGAYVAKGTRLISSEDEEGSAPVIFETADNTYITGAKIDNIFMTDGQRGSIYPILGNIEVPKLLNTVVTEEVDITTLEEDEEDASLEQKDEIEPFRLFGQSEGIGQNAICFYHSCIFDIENNDIFVRIEGNDSLIKDILNEDKYFAYATDGTIKRVESVRLLDDGVTFCLRKTGVNDKQRYDDKDYSMLAIIDDKNANKDEKVSKISFSAMGEATSPEFVGNDISEEDPKKVLPFTDEIEMYAEFFIGHSEYFKKAGSKIDVSFELSFEEKILSLSAEQEDEELKIIKKKPTQLPGSNPVDVYIQKLAIEYYNGVGWKRLKTDKELSAVFSRESNGKVEFSFTAPKDWDDNQVGAYEGRLLRFCVLKADNCYLRPAIHHYPVLKDIKISFTYEGAYVTSEAMRTIALTNDKNMRNALNSSENYLAFSKSHYDMDALYIGLNQAPAMGPVSLFVRLSEGKKYDPLSCVFEYSSLDGFKPLKVVDGTFNMTRSGIIMFLPPADFAAKNLDGNKKFYIRVKRDKSESEHEKNINLPVIDDIKLNGIVVRNIDTYSEQDFYLDEITVGAKFSLSQKGILDTEVWVNETDTLSNAAMKEMLSTNPDGCRAEYDILGEISAFYVLWKEVERFEEATDKRVYELDRLTSTIIFGNGITTDIPRAIDAPAIRVKVRCTDGELGNVEALTINSSLGNLMYIGDIYNPIKGYGGSAMESAQDALKRGSNIISNRKRLVSLNDFVNETKAFSDRIDQVKCISGEDTNGNELDGALSMVVLMKDYLDGSYSFHEIAALLKKHILNRCSITIPEDRLFITEPTFVDISVTAWVKIDRIQDAFDIQNKITDILDKYLDPVSAIGKRGWNIGTIPTQLQIQMKINSSVSEAIIRNVTVVASYTDHDGYHEVDINELAINKRMLCRSGAHKIHIDI